VGLLNYPFCTGELIIGTEEETQDLEEYTAKSCGPSITAIIIGELVIPSSGQSTEMDDSPHADAVRREYAEHIAGLEVIEYPAHPS
jgi:hypothetical protein